ncbi:MAG TPA: type III-B CRISPR-associated protein Cas10/Cmr2, partial [Allocoleopsis sp.]
ESLEKRPLFTMGKEATISFGIVIAHHSVPLAIALENLWEAEDQAKEHYYNYYNEKGEKKKNEKDAVEVRVLYSSGNILKARAKFEIFNNWKQLINMSNMEPGIFEICADLLNQHLIPKKEAIAPWVKYFCNQRSNLKDNKEEFEQKLREFMENLWEKTLEKEFNCELKNWLKIGAFVLRNREIKISSS